MQDDLKIQNWPLRWMPNGFHNSDSSHRMHLQAGLGFIKT
jgi:negative regulator of sigma E activity